jgi:NADH-quinone oxidoreductase subunit J
MSQSFA